MIAGNNGNLSTCLGQVKKSPIDDSLRFGGWCGRVEQIAGDDDQIDLFAFRDLGNLS